MLLASVGEIIDFEGGSDSDIHWYQLIIRAVYHLIHVLGSSRSRVRWHLRCVVGWNQPEQKWSGIYGYKFIQLVKHILWTIVSRKYSTISHSGLCHRLCDRITFTYWNRALSCVVTGQTGLWMCDQIVYEGKCPSPRLDWELLSRIQGILATREHLNAFQK